MREIKFRAWCGEQKRMFNKVLIGNTSDPSHEDYTAHCIYRDGCWYHSDEHDSVEFMQYTGFKNLEGKEVYEGDILSDVESEFEFFLARVHYDESQGKYVLLDWRGEYTGDLDEWYECPIVGNIHQNPELLRD
ncbi:YopX family protein [Shewanella chilikensis]|uniref:YopX family protein n=1 Tax=Shewanella chilikensis TaxID=558541 RepID=UPI003A979744